MVIRLKNNSEDGYVFTNQKIAKQDFMYTYINLN